ncbi:DUF1499 domain-containing protein [Celeribacter sp.]|uniref:DUF1499 domain-containing protein n=1 Tax=Celeribacter sp. TaxID=1890673 RepID=UPI003A94A4B7
MKLTLLALAGVFLALQAAIRLAPTDTARWHVDPVVAGDPGQAGTLQRVEVDLSPDEVLAKLANVAEATARTTRIAGSVEDGRITYRTRSFLWGFPDYTTIAATPTATGSTLTILARLRFGKSDVGVNGRRVAAWLDAAGLAANPTDP